MRTMVTITVFLLLTASPPTFANNRIDVINYHVEIEPNIKNKSLKGNVIIQYINNDLRSEIVFDTGHLLVDSVVGDNIKKYKQNNSQITIILSSTFEKNQTIRIYYHGTPKKGVYFEQNQMYTAYFTDEWMITNNQPDDKSKFTLDLIVPQELTTIANGKINKTQRLENNKKIITWKQVIAMPTYTYGFAIGKFFQVIEETHNVELNYYSTHYNLDQLKTIFINTADMISFFEDKSGMPYFQTSYSQILIGNHYQEMAGFSILKESYGEMVLVNNTETNLIGHELAHQWWGNMITCKDWNHFWLNESFATFMSAAYNEHKFGKEKYMQDIFSYKSVYEKLRESGNDKPLVFKEWSNPTTSDRNIVYFKGAYFLHLLRIKMGDKDFWQGVKQYSKKYYGKSVSTINFQYEMQDVTTINLEVFFKKWVY